MDEKLEDVLLIKNFLKMFDVYYEKVPYESMLELKYKGKTDLYQEENKVGTLFYDGNRYKIILSLNGFDLEALSEIKKDKGRRFLTLNYNLVKNSNEIAGKYTINSCNKKNDKNNGKTFVVKHKLYVYNDAISHKRNSTFANVRYDDNDKVLDYLYYYYNEENESLTTTGGYKLFKDNKEKDFGKVIKNYRIKMDELDPRYVSFVKEQKDTLEYFYDDLFKRIVDNSFTLLTDKEKEYIFGEKENNCYKLKR